jgi:uncharacterized RDD family membrane protein YckC
LSQFSALPKSADPVARPEDSFGAFDARPAEPSETAPAWKQEVNQRLAAHRNKRGGVQEEARAPENPRAASARAAAAAARVAARYAKAPSYNQLLAGEARAVVRAAGAAAEAALNAQAAAEAVLAGLEGGPRTSEPVAGPSRWQDEPPAVAAEPVRQENPWAGAQPRWEDTLQVASQAGGQDVWSEMRLHPEPSTYRTNQGSSGQEQSGGRRYAHHADEGELFPDAHLDSNDPMGSATVEPVQHLPANLIEFPRELVATRKARPRLAEGPFYDPAQENPQLSIFEVDPQLLAPPVYMSAAEVAPPEWASIELEHPEGDFSNEAASGVRETYAAHVYAAEPAIPESYATSEAVEELPAEDLVVRESAPVAQAWVSRPEAVVSAPFSELLVARFSDRLLAALVDGALVTLAFVAAAVVVIASTEHPPTGRIALIASGVALVLFAALYQFLFLSYAEEGTPGMRYARIALCTFDDDNPSVAQMQRRIPAMLLAAIPAGLGLIWAAFDSDHLGWHDRMTRTYQRKY